MVIINESYLSKAEPGWLSSAACCGYEDGSVVSDDQALCLSIQSDLGAIVVDTFIQQNSRNKKPDSYSGVEPTGVVIKVFLLEFYRYK